MFKERLYRWMVNDVLSTSLLALAATLLIVAGVVSV